MHHGNASTPPPETKLLASGATSIYPLTALQLRDIWYEGEAGMLVAAVAIMAYDIKKNHLKGVPSPSLLLQPVKYIMHI